MAEPPPGHPILAKLFTLQTDDHGHGFLTINKSRMTVPQTWSPRDNLHNLNSPLVAVGRTCGEKTNTLTHLMWPYDTQRQLNHNFMYTVDHTFSYRRRKFICTCMKLSAHAHGNKIRGEKFKYFKTSVGLAR